MGEHHPLCRYRPPSVVSGERGAPCDCDLIELVIVREQARIIEAIKAVDLVEWALAGQYAGALAIGVIRGDEDVE